MKQKMKEFPTKAKSFLIQCKRVWMILKKPTKKEFTLTAKIASIGVLLLGLLGFIIYLLMRIFV